MCIVFTLYDEAQLITLDLLFSGSANVTRNENVNKLPQGFLTYWNQNDKIVTVHYQLRL
ncbi:Uncharacterized protein BM_BM17411 [Brugia malayi]|uniref:Uncharacterized protein n=1 Tax=Brugia malayi TaxID=6279 RepID=A0A4E9F809_BRUMA|nr:Uncharacterized protein BM_BM17411 [Brugia malayi]VIO92307.1 Uncharacterized protein BM_BM17411 [Brugia malayi]